MESMLDAAKREIGEEPMQLRDLESIQNNHPPSAPASSTTESIAAAR